MTAIGTFETCEPIPRMSADRARPEIEVGEMSFVGTFRTSRDARLESVMRTKADARQRD